MHDAVFGMRLEKGVRGPHVTQGVAAREARDAVDPAAERRDFGFVGAGRGIGQQKVELYLLAVDVAVEVHQHGLGAAAVHAVQYVEYADHSW